MSPAPTLVDVDLLAVPVALHTRAQAHTDDLCREFRLMAGSDRGDTGHLPSRLLHLVRTLDVTCVGANAAQEQELEEAVARGVDSLDLRYTVPAAAAGAARELGAALADADECCRAGQLLTPATPPDLRAYRQWYLGEFVSQVGGAPPCPWTAVPPP